MVERTSQFSPSTINWMPWAKAHPLDDLVANAFYYALLLFYLIDLSGAAEDGSVWGGGGGGGSAPLFRLPCL
jgi:hypothetical protein